MESIEAMEVRGTLRVFGFDDTPARLEVVRRSAGWRASRAGGFVLAGFLAAPVVALIPPHAAWALGAVLAGIFLGLRKWSERLTLIVLEGRCPRCGKDVREEGPTRLKLPGSVDCPSCHHGATLLVADEVPAGG